MKKIMLIAAVVLLTACEGIVPGEECLTRIPTDPEDLAVWNAVYDKEYKYPDGFYVETGDQWTSIIYLGRNVTHDGRFVYMQYSADDLDEAREMWHCLMKDNSEQPTLMEERETEKYFEFKSVSISSHTTHITLWRFHKSSYYTPVDGMFSPFYYVVIYPELYKPYTMGIYSGELSSAAVREFIESLWYFETRQSYGDKVLSTDFKETSDSFVYTVTSVGVSYGDWGIHDEIYVFESVFELNKKTRELRSTGCALLKNFQGR